MYLQKHMGIGLRTSPSKDRFMVSIIPICDVYHSLSHNYLFLLLLRSYTPCCLCCVFSSALETIEYVHCVFMTHLDVGFTDLVVNVEYNYFTVNLPTAIATAQALRERGGMECICKLPALALLSPRCASNDRHVLSCS